MLAEIPWRSSGPDTAWDWTNPLSNDRTGLGSIAPWRTILDQVSVENLGTEDVMLLLQMVVQRASLHCIPTNITVDPASFPGSLGVEADSAVGVDFF
jgi:hypothetical protein